MRVILTHHVQQRLHERISEHLDFSPIVWAAQHVEDAISDMRMTRSIPKWALLIGARRYKNKKSSDIRFVKSDDPKCVFVLDIAGNNICRVLTVLTPPPPSIDRVAS